MRSLTRFWRERTIFSSAEVGRRGAAPLCEPRPWFGLGGAGFFRDLPGAAETLVTADRTIEPDRTLKGVYDDLYARYTDLYTALGPIVNR